MSDGDAHDQLNIFISYTRKDGAVHAQSFVEKLSRSPRYSVTYDERFSPSVGIDRSIEAAIGIADVMLVLLTDSVFEKHWVRTEVLYAQHLNELDERRDRIRLVVAQLTAKPQVPISIIELPRLPFATDAAASWAALYAELERASAPANGARPFCSGPGDRHDQRYAAAAREAADRAREERRRADDLAGAEERLRQRVDAEWRRQGTTASSVRSEAAIRFVNEMPELPEIGFQDRVPKMAELDDALHEASTRVVLITGEGGAGKTAFLREYRRRLATGDLTAPTAGFVYLAARGYREISAAALLNDLALLAPDVGELQRMLRRQLPWRQRLDAVLAALGDLPIVVALDDAEDLLNPHGEIRENDLRFVLSELVRRPEHRIRVLMVVEHRRSHPIRGEWQPHVVLCDLEKGLPPEHTTPFLRALDSEGLLDVENMPPNDLHHLAVISDGNPRFLELTYCLLRSEPSLTLAAMFGEIDARRDAAARDPFPLLIDAVLARLERTDRRVVQALAVYRHPVSPAAVDYLLESHVPGIDSAPILDLLAARRLVRRDGGRYFLPPTPDASCVMDSVPIGRPGDWRIVQPLFTRPFLRRRAADFYAKASSGKSVHGPDDLQPHLREIELRIAAGDHEVAVELMETIDDDYLTPWGQSGVLMRWREKVDVEVAEGTRWRAANLSYLISALVGEDHTGRWADRLHQVLTEPWVRKAPEDRIRFGIQLADLLADNGSLAPAATRYGECAGRCRSKAMRYEAVMARAGRGLCLARIGSFDEAAREFELASKWLPEVDDKHQHEAAAVLRLNEGWMLGQLGDTTATAVLQIALASARGRDELLTGRVLDALAALYCDSKQIDKAIEPAIEAAKIAMRTGHPGLIRTANETLALVYLLDKDLANAAAAIHAAAQQPSGMPALGTRTVEGVIHYRRGEITKARAAFHAACTEAWLRLERAPDEYAVYDAAGLALTGLQLCREAHRMPRALDMYRTARRIAPVQGARRRSKAQLALLEPVPDPTVLEAAQRAADGDDAGARQFIA